MVKFLIIKIYDDPGIMFKFEMYYISCNNTMNEIYNCNINRIFHGLT